MNMPTAQEFLTRLAKDMAQDREHSSDYVKGYAKLMELREESRLIEGLQMARCATDPDSDEEKRIDTIINNLEYPDPDYFRSMPNEEFREKIKESQDNE